jgi:hypothetical protein
MAPPEARPASWEDSVASATEDSVIRWRMLVLLRAGYKWNDAVELATQTGVDLHLAVDLAERGCASETARRILL